MSIWVTAKECLGLPGLPSHVHNIRLRLEPMAGETLKRTREGSKAFEYHYSCLPLEARTELLKQRGLVEIANKLIPIPKKKINYVREALWYRFEQATDAKREKAIMRAKTVLMAMGLIETGVEVLDAFKTAGQEYGVSGDNVKRWYYEAKHFEKEDFPAVLLAKNGTNVEANKKRQIPMTPEAFDFFCADFLRLEKPSEKACYRRLQAAASEHGWIIPSATALRDKIKREIPKEHIILLREGEHALMSSYPPQIRSVLDIGAGQWLNGDGYKHNVFVKWFNGEIIRPVTWVWQDVRTRKILGWRTDVSENTDTIRLSFLDVITKYCIPRDVTIDNTRAASNKWMTGSSKTRHRFKRKEDEPLGMFPALGIQMHFTTINYGQGHGQAKPIERAFGTGGLGEVVDKHPTLAGAYTGPNPMEKPANYGKSVVSAEVFLKALAEGIAQFNSQTHRNTEACHGELSFDQAFVESYNETVAIRATPEQRAMFLLQAEAVTIDQTGCFYLSAGGKIGNKRNRYYNQTLLSTRQKKVVVRFDPKSLHDSVRCYTLDGRFICEATCTVPAGFGDSQAAREHTRNRNIYVRKTKEAAVAFKNMSIQEMAAIMSKPLAPGIPKPAAIEIFRPVSNLAPQAILDTRPDDLSAEQTEKAFSNAVNMFAAKKEKNRI